jgi:hypothetical protein
MMQINQEILIELTTIKQQFNAANLIEFMSHEFL